MTVRRPFRTLIAAVVGIVVAASLAACGGGSSTSDSGSASGDKPSSLTLKEARAPLPSGSKPELVAIRKQANELVETGQDGFDAELAKLKKAGIPVVVNKWASWCGPCREEFPELQDAAKRDGAKVAFIGLNSNDGPDTAKQFLSERPLPYPSYSDSDQGIANSLDSGREFPSTIFIDPTGKVAYKQVGPFTSGDQLQQAIDQFSQ